MLEATADFLISLSSVSAYFFIRTFMVIGIGFAILKWFKVGKERRIYRIAYGKNQLSREFFTNLEIIPFYSLLFAVIFHFELIQFSDFTLMGFVFTFGLTFVWNELWFYWLHRLFHQIVFQKLHHRHHRSVIPSPLSFMTFSFSEIGAQVLCAMSLPILIAPFLPITLEGLAVYGIFQLLVNLLGHMNLEVFPKGFASHGIGKYLNTPTFHSMHHARMNSHYGMLSTIPDLIWGTYDKDYPQVQSAAASGNGLKSLSQKFVA